MLKRIIPPTSEPVSLAEAKAHLRVDFDADDDLITALIIAAREACEHRVSRSFIDTTWRYSIDYFPWAWNRAWTQYDYGIPLPIADAIEVVGITYIDSAGTAQTLPPTAYWLVNGPPAFLYPAFGTTWPAPNYQSGAVTIEFVAGYGDDAESVPESVKTAIKLVLGNLYENREDTTEARFYELPMGACWLLAAADWGGTRV